VTEFLQDKHIDVVLSSPYKRAVDTIADFAEKSDLVIETIEDFREQRSSSYFSEKNGFTDPVHRKHMIEKHLENQWADFTYSLSDDDDGERLSEVQERNNTALNEVLKRYKDKNIVIGTHGTALSTIINYYDNAYGYDDFMAMVNILPWIVKMTFDGNDCVKIELPR